MHERVDAPGRDAEIPRHVGRAVPVDCRADERDALARRECREDPKPLEALERVVGRRAGIRRLVCAAAAAVLGAAQVVQAEDVRVGSVAERVPACARANRVEDGTPDVLEREGGEGDAVGRVVLARRLDERQVPVGDQVVLVEAGVAPPRGFSPREMDRLLHEGLLGHSRTDDSLLGRGQGAQEQPPRRVSFRGGLGALCTTACSLRAVVGATAGG